MNRSALAVVALSAFLAGCGEPVVETPEERARPINIISLGGGDNGAVVEYTGTISAAQRSEMGFEVPGRIVEFPVTAGQVVQQGQILARLDPIDFEADLDKAVANHNAAKADVRRYEQAFSENAVTRQDLDVARRNLEVAAANLRSAQKAFSDAELKAPFDGVVAKKLVDDFANVQAKQPVLVLEDDSSLEIDVNLPEQDWARSKPGLSIAERSARVSPRVRIGAIPGREFPAELTELDTTADPVTRTYGATFDFATPEDVIVRPGMTGSVVLTVPSDIVVGELAVTTLPSAVVRSDEQGNAFVWRITDEMRATKQPVTVGEFVGDRVRIRGGLEPGMRIAGSGVHNLREGTLVREYQP